MCLQPLSRVVPGLADSCCRAARLVAHLLRLLEEVQVHRRSFSSPGSWKRRDQREARARRSQQSKKGILSLFSSLFPPSGCCSSRSLQLPRVTKTSRRHGSPRSDVRRCSAPAAASAAPASAAPACSATGRRRSRSGRGRGGATSAGIGGSHAPRRSCGCRFLPL